MEHKNYIISGLWWVLSDCAPLPLPTVLICDSKVALRWFHLGVRSGVLYRLELITNGRKSSLL